MRRNPDDEDPFNGINQMINDFMGGEEHVDIHEYDDRIKVVADIPVVEREDIDLDCDGRNLIIRASAETKPVVMQVDLPAYVDDQSTNTNFNNGVLEVTLDRENDPANIGFQ